MATLATYQKDPSDIVDYTIDWSPFLAQDGDGIATSAWAVTPAGPTIGTASKTSTTTTTFLSGGTASTSYTLTNTITTNRGRTLQRSLTISVLDL